MSQISKDGAEKLQVVRNALNSIYSKLEAWLVTSMNGGLYLLILSTTSKTWFIVFPLAGGIISKLINVFSDLFKCSIIFISMFFPKWWFKCFINL